MSKNSAALLGFCTTTRERFHATRTVRVGLGLELVTALMQCGATSSSAIVDRSHCMVG